MAVVPASDCSAPADIIQVPAVKVMDATVTNVDVLQVVLLPICDNTSPILPAATVDAPLLPVRLGVAIVGDVPKTAAPVPVSSVRADARLALDGVPSQVATLVPKPLTSVLIATCE